MDVICQITAEVNGENKTWISRNTWLDAPLHIVQKLPNCKLVNVRCEIPFTISNDTKIFMNGYQTWTTSKEYSTKDKIRGLHYLPKGLVKKYAFDGYGDYHFVNYPNKKGITHGVSYCYFRRNEMYQLFATLDETNGYSLFQYDAKKNLLTIEKDCSGLEVEGEFHAFDLYYQNGTEYTVFDGWFEALQLNYQAPKKLYGYSSWYNRYENINEICIQKDLEGCKKILQPGDVFQIDDGWEEHIGDWLRVDKNKFPNGMKNIADQIHAEGYRAGIWLAPFAVEKDSRLMKEHPDWLLYHDNEPFRCGSNWSGFYGLDIDLPEVQDYIKTIFDCVLHEWGYDLVKLDFLYVAATFGTKHETRAAKMIRAMKLLRECCKDKLILGCGVPIFPSFGNVDYCRISCDVSLDYDDKLYMRAMHRERVSTKNAMTNVITRHPLNGRFYASDPDVFFLRKNNISLTKEQKETLIYLDALLGSVFFTSDNPMEYDDEMIATYQKYRHLSHAQVLDVKIESNIIIKYELDGQISTKQLPIPWR